jgi:hypothetical protein
LKSFARHFSLVKAYHCCRCLLSRERERHKKREFHHYDKKERERMSKKFNLSHFSLFSSLSSLSEPVTMSLKQISSN